MLISPFFKKIFYIFFFSECCELLVTCTDFTLRHPIDAKKFEFVQSKLHLIDYKGLRSILKLLVVDRMQEMPSQISHYHRQMLLPVENVVISHSSGSF